MAHSHASMQPLGQVSAHEDDDPSSGSFDAAACLLEDFANDMLSIEDLLDPLPDLDNDVPVPVPSISTAVSHGSSFDQGGEALLDFDDIEYLMTGDLLDEHVHVPATMDLTREEHGHGKNEARVKHTTATPTATTVPLPLLKLPVDNPIHRIMLYLHYTEPDRHLVAHVHGVLQSCIAKHQKHLHKNPGSKVNLSGRIFEELVRLFGDHFSAIYRNAMTFSPPPQSSSTMNLYGNPPPSSELAIAYGVHIANHYQATHGTALSGAHAAKYVEQGIASLTSMSENERRKLWDFMMTTKESCHF